jgi:hypothetical protein
MHTAVSETTPHTFGRGDAYSLTVTSYQLVISYQFHDWGNTTPRAQKALVSVQPHYTPDHCSVF